MATILIKNRYFILSILFLFQCFSSLPAQDTSSVPTQFPTIKNDPSIDLDNPNQEQETQTKVKKRRRNSLSAEGYVQTRSYFYSDIIKGGLVFLIGIVGYLIFQKIKKEEVR